MNANEAARRRAILIAEHDRCQRRTAFLKSARAALLAIMATCALFALAVRALDRVDYPRRALPCPAGWTFSEADGCRIGGGL